MFQILMALVFKAREAVQGIAQKGFQRLRKSDGKLKYVSPQAARKILIVGFSTFFALIIITQLFNRDKYLKDSFGDYQKELRNDAGLRMRDFNGKALFDSDPLSSSGYNDIDITSGATTTSVTPRTNDITADIGGAVEVPAASDCLSLIEKTKNGDSLSTLERSQIKACVENDVVPLSEEEKNALLALSEGDLSDSEREAVLNSLSGKGSSAEKDLVSVIAASLNPDKKQEFSDAINDALKDSMVELNPEELRALSELMSQDPNRYKDAIEASSKLLAGKTLTERDKDNLIKAIMEAKGGEKAALDNPNLSTDKEKALQMLLEDTTARQDKIDDLERKLSEAQAAAREPVEKLQKGLALTKEEQASIDRLSQIRKELDQLKEVQEKRQRTLIELTGRLQKTVAQAAMALQKTIPSGVFEGYADYEPIDCKNLKPLPVARKKKKQETNSNQKIALSEKPAYNFYRLEDEAKKNGVDYEGKRLDPSAVLGERQINIGELFVAKGDNNKTITISPETKIAAILDSEIITAGNGSGQVVRIKILQDVYDAKNRQLIIPKNSIGIGRTSGFDENTGIMDFTLSKVSVGSGNSIDVSLRVGSGDGTMGLKGQIRDSRGRFLFGTFVTAFTAGALDFISQNTISQFQQSQRLITAVQGSALSGGAEVATKISNMFANDLMNSPSIFYCPRGLPIVLYPDL